MRADTLHERSVGTHAYRRTFSPCRMNTICFTCLYTLSFSPAEAEAGDDCVPLPRL